MNKKGIFISILITLFILGIYGLNIFYENNYVEAKKAYKVYLNGNEIGLISGKDDLYNEINSAQKSIKDKYNVDYVYPPVGLDVVETNTYDEDYLKASELYKKIENEDDFTIKGYVVTIKSKEKSDIKINVLSKDIFTDALKKVIFSFVSEEEYEKYQKGDIADITDIGSVIQSMYFEETITIKEGFISVKENIFTDVDSLSQYLLFGPNAKMDSYKVLRGDSIDSISEKYKLNPQEFIIANPEYRKVDAALKEGENVNVTLINPVLTFCYDVYKIERKETPFQTKVVYDNSKPANYDEPTTPGITGITVNYERYKVTNGEQGSEVDLTYVTEREVQNEVRTKGRKYYANAGTGTYVPLAGDWGWPTNTPYIITSRYAYRGGKLHAGVDISGTGYGSPVYAAADGVVTDAENDCGKNNCSEWKSGTYVIIKHENGYHSSYLHLAGKNVKAGDVVKKGQRIGSIGESGYAFGAHLHFAVFRSHPHDGNNSFNPLSLYKGIS